MIEPQRSKRKVTAIMANLRFVLFFVFHVEVRIARRDSLVTRTQKKFKNRNFLRGIFGYKSVVLRQLVWLSRITAQKLLRT